MRERRCVHIVSNQFQFMLALTSATACGSGVGSSVSMLRFATFR